MNKTFEQSLTEFNEQIGGSEYHITSNYTDYNYGSEYCCGDGDDDDDDDYDPW